MMTTNFLSVDEYIAAQPAATQAMLQEMRVHIRQQVPAAVECISYKMPAYKLNGKPLVYFAAYKNHIGFYATPTGHKAFAKELAAYKQGKGSVQFPINEPLPINLIGRIAAFRAQELSRNTKATGKQLNQ